MRANLHEGGGSFRWKLFGQASVLALGAVVLAPKKANAADDGGLTLELSGGPTKYQDGDTTFLPPAAPFSDRVLEADDGSAFRGALTFQPAGSPNIFSLGVKFGKSKHSSKSLSFSTSGTSSYSGPSGPGILYTQYHLDLDARQRSEHLMVDFEVGREVGMGMASSSVVSVGLRYANFKVDTDIAYSGALTSGVLLTGKYNPPTGTDARAPAAYAAAGKYYGPYVNLIAGSGQIRRKFQGIGPRISWKAQHDFADSGFFLSWGVGANLLYGKREAHGVASDPTLGVDFDRDKKVWSPGFDAAVAIGYTTGPVSLKLGYQVDAQYGVIDAGFEKEVKHDYVTHGPFASIVWKIF